MTSDAPPPAGAPPPGVPLPNDRVGLCATCAHAQIIISAKGSTFYLCRLSYEDPRFCRYPPLPVRACRGYRADR